MLLLKRLVATLIDLLLFYSTVISFHYLTSSTLWSIDGSNGIYLISFFVSVIIPIIFFSNTAGSLILKINIKEENNKPLRVTLYIKYLIFFTLLSSEVSAIFSFIEDIVDTFTYIKIPETFIMRLTTVLISLNFFCCIYTLGRQNLIDYILNLNYKHRNKKYPRLTLVILSYLFSGSMALSTAVEHSLKRIFDFNSLMNESLLASQAGYFPMDIFSKYVNLPISSKIILTNNLIVTCDMNSVVFNQYLLQNVINVSVTKDVINDTLKKLELCEKLIEYANINLKHMDNKVAQIKIQLSNFDHNTPITLIRTYYTYYYDNIFPVNGINGNYDVDTLEKFYTNTQKNIASRFNKYLKDTLEINSDSIDKYTLSNGDIDMPSYLFPKNATPFYFNFEDVIDSSIYRFKVIPFSKVSGVKSYEFILTARSDYPQIVDDDQESYTGIGKIFYLKSHYFLSNLDENNIVSKEVH